MFRTIAALSALVGAAASASAQQFFEGYDVSFSKASFVDPLAEANQDRITDSVWLTRGNTQGLFNAFAEASYTSFSSPADTEWAFGTIADGVGMLSFSDWQTWAGSNPPGTVGQDAVLHLISEDIYLDIRFTNWGIGGGAGGNFSYVRAVVPAPGATLMLGLGSLALTRRRR